MLSASRNFQYFFFSFREICYNGTFKYKGLKLFAFCKQIMTEYTNMTCFICQ